MSKKRKVITNTAHFFVANAILSIKYNKYFPYVQNTTSLYLITAIHQSLPLLHNHLVLLSLQRKPDFPSHLSQCFLQSQYTIF